MNAKRAKNEVFGHFIEFGWFDWSDIAYDDCTKYLSTFANAYRSWISNQLCISNLIHAKRAKMRVP